MCSWFGQKLDIQTIYENKNEGSHFNPLHDSFRIYKEILKFALSSIVSFFLDYTLYAFQIFLGIPLVTANITARIISAGFNFFVNKKFVFASDKPVFKELGGYILLASFSLTLNTLILMGISYGLGIGPLVGKIMTEIGMFFFNWFVQKKLIFGQEKGVHYVK